MQVMLSKWSLIHLALIVAAIVMLAYDANHTWGFVVVMASLLVVLLVRRRLGRNVVS